MIKIKKGELIKYNDKYKRIIQISIQDYRTPDRTETLYIDELFVIENSLEWLFKKIKIKYNNFKQIIRNFFEFLYCE